MRDWAAFQRGDPRHQWLGYESLSELLQASGYVPCAPALIDPDKLVSVPPMPRRLSVQEHPRTTGD